MPSLLSLPDEILDIIGNHLDATSLSNWAHADARLRSSATRCTRRLKVASVTPALLDLLKQRVETVQYLDLSNCNSSSAPILALINRCRSVKELNVVNCKLQFAQLARAVESLTELDRLSCCYFDKSHESPCGRTVFAEHRRNPTDRPGFSSLRHIYVELPPSWPSITHFAAFLSQCSALEKLHINLLGICPPSTPREQLRQISSRELTRPSTIIVSTCTGSRGFVLAFLDYLFMVRLDSEALHRWKSSESTCFVYENGNINTIGSYTFNSEETDVLRDAYHVRLESQLAEQMSFPWGRPRGLKIDFVEPNLAEHAAALLRAPVTWSSDLVELDLTGCLPNLPGDADWSNLIESSPSIEAMAISSCFLPPQETAECSRIFRQPKRKRSQCSFLTLLTSIKLKRLFITGDCVHFRVPLISHQEHHRQYNFNGIDKLAYLEELTLHKVIASQNIFASLANPNVRIVRLLLDGVANVSKLKEFIQKSVKLKYFKLEMPTLALSSVLLWDALAEGGSLEQVCLGTMSRDTVQLSVIDDHLPRCIARLRVLHVHAHLAGNRNKLKATISRHAKQHKGESLDFVTESVTSPKQFVFPGFFPGRALCCVSNNVATIRPVGWDLP